MTIKQELVDTNVLVRFFTGEPPEMASKARRLVERADNGEIVLVVLPVIVAVAVTLWAATRPSGAEPKP